MSSSSCVAGGTSSNFCSCFHYFVFIKVCVFINWCNKASGLLFFTQNITVLFSWTCWETLCYLNCKMLAFWFLSMVCCHISCLWCVTVYLLILQVSVYDLAHLITPKKFWYEMFDFFEWGYVMDIVYAKWVKSLKDVPPKNMMVAATVTPALPSRMWSVFCHILKPT
jgi:hypothetical protein